MLKKFLFALGLIAILIFASISGQIGKGLGRAVFSHPKASPQEVEAKLIEGFTISANQQNQRLPMMLDQDTRLDRVTVGPGPRAVYHYTFPKYTSRAVDANWLHTNLRLEVKKNVCVNKDMKKSIQLGGIYVYAYYGIDGVEITRFEIDRNDCGFSKLPL